MGGGGRAAVRGVRRGFRGFQASGRKAENEERKGGEGDGGKGVRRDEDGSGGTASEGGGVQNRRQIETRLRYALHQECAHVYDVSRLQGGGLGGGYLV